MPVQACTKDGKEGFKWGPSGFAFTGDDARQRATAVGRAINAQKDGKKPESEWASQAEFELSVAEVPGEELPGVLASLPFLPEEFTELWVKKADDELQIVWGEVYIPDVPDVDDEYMTASEVQKMAHKFLMEGRSKGCIDVKHDNEVRDQCFVVESFIARKNDPEFIEGAWVAGVKVLDTDIWKSIKSGELNGFSMQARVAMEERIVTLDIPQEVIGDTQIASDGDGHRHKYRVAFNEDGEFQGGDTDVVQAHKHRIGRRSITGTALDAVGQPLADSHFHRYTLMDQLVGRDEPEVPGGIEG